MTVTAGGGRGGEGGKGGGKVSGVLAVKRYGCRYQRGSNGVALVVLSVLAGLRDRGFESLDKAGAIFIGAGNKVELPELADKVKAIFANRAEEDRKIYIKGDSSLGYGKIMEVMSALHAGGITQIGLVSATPDGKGA